MSLSKEITSGFLCVVCIWFNCRSFKESSQLFAKAYTGRKTRHVPKLSFLFLMSPAEEKKRALLFKQSNYYQPCAATVWQVSTVIIARKEIIALSSGSEVVSAHLGYDPHHPNPYSQPASSHLYYTGW